MTLAWHSWLPEDALVSASAQRALAELVEAWAREWFPGEPLRVLGQFACVAAPRSELRKLVWHRCNEGVAIGLPSAGATVLGALVLDVPMANGTRGDEDLKLLAALGKECLDGLKSRLAQLLGLGKADWHLSDITREEGAVYRLEIGSATRAITLQLEYSADRFARFVRATLPEVGAKEPLADGAAALARIPVALSARLGCCGLTLAELSGLTSGDVLVLDSVTEESLPLALDGTPLARGRCIIVEAAGGPAFKITQAPAR